MARRPTAPVLAASYRSGRPTQSAGSRPSATASDQVSVVVNAEELAAGVRAGQVRAIARAISWVEDEDARADALLAALYPSTGRARTVGVTGPPGAGKSTLVDRLAAIAHGAGHRVAVVAVDPASPFTGGAIL